MGPFLHSLLCAWLSFTFLAHFSGESPLEVTLGEASELIDQTIWDSHVFRSKIKYWNLSTLHLKYSPCISWIQRECSGGLMLCTYYQNCDRKANILIKLMKTFLSLQVSFDNMISTISYGPFLFGIQSLFLAKVQQYLFSSQLLTITYLIKLDCMSNWRVYERNNDKLS
jgi:hypothetical protein